MELVRRHRFTVEEYHRMGEAGIFSEDDRVELIGGAVVEMAPIGSRHMQSVARLKRVLSRWTFESPEDAALFVSVQNPLVLFGKEEPQPDLVLLRRSAERSDAFSSDEALLVVEVADTSLRYDRETKLPLYAAAGIPEAWIVDLTEDRVEVYSVPAGEGYGAVSRAGRGERMVSPTVADLAFDTVEALPPGE
jgi:Uma2 family endonuclease